LSCDGYQARGRTLDVGGLECYMVGQGRRAIVVGHDAFGVDSGRTKQISDELADALGVIVAVPSFWASGSAGGFGRDEADVMAPTGSRPTLLRRVYASLRAVARLPCFVRELRAINWEVVGPMVHDHLLPMLREHGAERVGLMGFCWGGWLVLHASGSSEFCCGATLHPSQDKVCRLQGEDLRGLCEQVQCPQIILTAGNDSPKLMEHGIAHEVFRGKPFGSECTFQTFGEMKHGWVNRASLEDPAVHRDYTAAMDLVTQFFRKHLCEA